MDKEDKLIKMYEAVHGELPTHTGCSLHTYTEYSEYASEEDPEEEGVCCIKDGSICWRFSKSELLFDYITLDW